MRIPHPIGISPTIAFQCIFFSMVKYQAHRPLAASFFLGHCLQPLLQPHSLKTIKQDADKSAKHLKQDADKPAKHKSIHEQIHRRPGWRNSPLSE